MVPISYVYDGAYWCHQCLPVHDNHPDVGAMFHNEESDAPMHCDDCREFLGGVLTPDGFMWLKENYLKRRWRDKKLLKQYIDYWRYSYDWFFIPTHYGWLDPLGNLKDID